MATHSIRMKKKNGAAWDILYPLTIANNVAMVNGQTVQHEIDNVFTKTATSIANGAMSASDKTKIDGIEIGANKYIHPNDPSIRHVTDTQIALWSDKYNKLEMDNKFNELHVGLDWKESVSTFADLATIYPSPIDGWTVNVKDTDTTYRYGGVTWISISANSIPLATQLIDGKMSKLDKKALDKAVIDVGNISADMSSISRGFSRDITGLLTRMGGNEAANTTNTTDIGILKTGKANTIHNHDTVYSKLGHTHDYAATIHAHSDYLSINGGTLAGDLAIKKSLPTLDFKKIDGTLLGKVRTNDTGSVVISAGADKAVLIRPNGDASSVGEIAIGTTGMSINGLMVSVAGHGVHIPAVESDLTSPRFLRNDNTWQTLTPSSIGASASNHGHSYSAINDKPTGLEGQIPFYSTDGSDNTIAGHALRQAVIVESPAELTKAKLRGGNITNTIYDISTDEAWSYVSGTWSKDINKNLIRDMGVGRFIYNPDSRKLFFINAGDETVNVSSQVDLTDLVCNSVTTKTLSLQNKYNVQYNATADSLDFVYMG